MRHAMRMTNRNRLRDAAANAVTDDARLRDAQLIEQLDDALGMCAHVDAALTRAIAAAVAEEIEHDETVAAGHERHDIAPQMTGGGETVDEHHGNTGAARSRRVVV